jgi:hypothetical protein
LYSETGVFGVFIKEMSSDLYSLLAVPGVVSVFIKLVIGRFGVLSIWKNQLQVRDLFHFAIHIKQKKSFP